MLWIHGSMTAINVAQISDIEAASKEAWVVNMASGKSYVVEGVDLANLQRALLQQSVRA
jgi:hypothetical protein